MTSFELKLTGFNYGDIYEAERLPVLDELFLRFLADRDRLLAAQFRTYRNGAETGAVAESGLLIEVGRCLEDFLVDVFGVAAARDGLRATAVTGGAYSRVQGKIRQAARTPQTRSHPLVSNTG